MREVKFRGQRVDTKEWVYGYYTSCKRSSAIYSKCYNPPDSDPMWKEVLISHEVSKETVGQYTGLKDKNGKEIYEGDIVKTDDIISVIRYEEENARFVIDDYGTKGCLMEYGFDECEGKYGVVDTSGFDDFCDITNAIEIIGNIFEDGDLLDN